MSKTLLSESEVIEIRRMIKETDKELERQMSFSKTMTYKSLSYINKIPHKFRAGYLKHQRDKLAKQINYII